MIRFFCFIILCIFSSTLLADGEPIHIHISNIISRPSHFYSYRLQFNTDQGGLNGVPTQLGTGFLNRYFIGATANANNYLEFGYYNPATQGTTWFPNDYCKVILNHSMNISVTVTPTICRISRLPM